MIQHEVIVLWKHIPLSGGGGGGGGSCHGYMLTLQAVCDHNPEKALLSSGLDRHQQAKASPPPSADEEDRGVGDDTLFFILSMLYNLPQIFSPFLLLFPPLLFNAFSFPLSPPSLLYTVPCEFCNQLFPFQLLDQHQVCTY